MSTTDLLTAEKIAVYRSYSLDNPPPHPGSQWTRFICLSDTHCQRFPVPPGDVLLHSGDLTSKGKITQLKITMDWINALPHSIKVVIAGNHDFTLHTDWYESNWQRFHHVKEDPRAAKEIMTGDKARSGRVTYLDYSSTELQIKPGGRKWKFYGSPGSPWFGGWAFNYERGDEAKVLHQNIPSDTDILLTHGPPASVLDMVRDGHHAGCEELMNRVAEVRPILHVFGHIHEDHGVDLHQWPPSTSSFPSKRERTIFVNASNLPTPVGEKARKANNFGENFRVGGPGFQPVIIDFFDPGSN